MALFFRQKKSDAISRSEPGYEEGERHTPWTGVILLLIMFVAGLLFGWRAVDDLARVPTAPASLSLCSEPYLDRADYQGPIVTSPVDERFAFSPKFVTEDTPCEYNDLEITHGIPALIDQKKNIEKQLFDALAEDQAQYNSAAQKRQALESQYNLRLQEIQAGVPAPVGAPTLATLQTQVAEALNEEIRLQQLLSSKETQARANSQELKNIEEQLATVYRAVVAEQNRRLRFFEFKVFLLQLLFILPIFLLALRLYLRHLKRNSPYAIILTAVVAVMGVLLLRIILVWFWDLFLARLIEELWRWIQQFQLVRSLVLYLGMVLSFVIFGGAVYYLQKRIFDPQRVAIRRFRQNQCPECQTTLDLAGIYCPNCGHHIREQCWSCGAERFRELPYCPHCAARPTKEPKA